MSNPNTKSQVMSSQICLTSLHQTRACTQSGISCEFLSSSCSFNAYVLAAAVQATYWLLLPPDFSVTLVGNRGTYLSKGRKTLLSLSIFQLQGQNPGTLVTSPIADQWILIPVIPQNMVQPMVQWSNGPIGLDMFGSIMIHPKYPKFCSSFGVPSLDELKHRLILTAGSSHCETHCVTT